MARCESSLTFSINMGGTVEFSVDCGMGAHCASDRGILLLIRGLVKSSVTVTAHARVRAFAEGGGGIIFEDFSGKFLPEGIREVPNGIEVRYRDSPIVDAAT